MSIALTFTPTATGTEFRLLDRTAPVPFESWAVAAPASLLPAVDLFNRLDAEGHALTDGALVVVEHAAIAGLSAAEAAALTLPPLSDAVAHVETHGIVTRPEFKATIHWRRATGQALVGARRIGAWLNVGGQLRRLSSPLFAIAEAVDGLVMAGEDPGARLLAIGKLQELLPDARKEGKASVGGLLPAIEIMQADAFSLDLVGEGATSRLVPILHRAGDPEPVLPSDLQSTFGEVQFNSFAEVRPIYTLGSGRFVVLSPTLRRALNEVRKRQSGPSAIRRAFLAAPRAFLRSALEGEEDPTLIDTVFVETSAYSDRVTGLGIWTPRVVPWLQRAGADWFGPDMPGQRILPGGLLIGDRRLDLDPVQAEDLRSQVENAIGHGAPTVVWAPPGESPIIVPANEGTRRALTELANQRASARSPASEKYKKAGDGPAESLLILTNEGEVEYSQDFVPRVGPVVGLPGLILTMPKPHQRHGIEWLQKCWLTGKPGVLLADDMGLGKTLQGLAFLAWLREGMTVGELKPAPMMIVAPTGLLANWQAEHDRHLGGDGLGSCVVAYGGGLRSLLTVNGEGVPSLDRAKLASAAWVLTTYETLRDYDRDFGAVRFAVLLADEAQKVKTPGARVTDAMKGMNADFRIALTGTPVENRLADLWCIVDGVHSGFLGDLKGFSRLYEVETELKSLKGLKSRLEGPFGGTPPLLLRRMKEDELPDLPRAETHTEEVIMPVGQAAAYNAVVTKARGEENKGAILAALQKLRLLALHPDMRMSGNDEDFIAASARLKVCFAALDRIAAKGEQALIFLDSIDMQSRLVGLIQRRYRLPTLPAIINGEVAGHKRQERVDRFQSGPDGFGVMVLSTRAGGVGLTLTRANHVIHLERWWNPAVEDQCTGRALRIGQKKTVHIHIPIGILGDARRSFDQNLHDLLERKRTLMREALLPGGFDQSDQQSLFEATIA